MVKRLAWRNIAWANVEYCGSSIACGQSDFPRRKLAYESNHQKGTCTKIPYESFEGQVAVAYDVDTEYAVTGYHMPLKTTLRWKLTGMCQNLARTTIKTSHCCSRRFSNTTSSVVYDGRLREKVREEAESARCW